MIHNVPVWCSKVGCVHFVNEMADAPRHSDVLMGDMVFVAADVGIVYVGAGGGVGLVSAHEEDQNRFLCCIESPLQDGFSKT